MARSDFITRKAAGRRAGLTGTPGKDDTGRTLGPVADTQDRIIEAATECFLKFGIKKTTIDDIASVSGLSRPTVYRYFPGKLEITREIGLRGVASINVAVADRVRTVANPLLRIVEAMATAIEFVSADDYMRGMLLGEAGATMRTLRKNFPGMDKLTHQRLEPLLQGAMKAKLMPRGLDIEETIDWIMMVQIGLIMAGTADRLGPAGLRAYLERYVIKGLTR